MEVREQRLCPQHGAPYPEGGKPGSCPSSPTDREEASLAQQDVRDTHISSACIGTCTQAEGSLVPGWVGEAPGRMPESG